jgi:hypothetical protein
MRRIVSCAVAVLALMGCRGVLGIEPLGLEGDGGSEGDASVDAAGTPDATTTDGMTVADTSPVDTGPDLNLPPPVEPMLPDGGFCSSDQSTCRPCCRTNFQNAFGAYQHYAMQTGCVCGSGLCQSECATADCTNPPGPRVDTCARCLDNALKGSTEPCELAAVDCTYDGNCANAVNCFRKCN